jgi:hypothetical protein
MMPSIRLLDTLDWVLREFELGSAPPYLAVSHAWSDHIFPPETPIFSSLGGKVVQKVVGTCFPTIHHCWVDNFCIKQNDEDDKLQQIPLMGSIYHNSDAVIVVLSCEIGFVQDDVDAATRGLTDALQVWRDQSWAETHHAEYFQRGPGRRKLILAMKGLARFTCSTWATRIWTLQEYVLAQEVVWIGRDMHPIRMNDRLFQAIPELCDHLAIKECMSRETGTEFAILHTHFKGMANSRFGDIETTRIMELLGNRKATVPVDEVYGIMSASTVEIDPIKGETREEAWERWCESAVLQGHGRWLMLPPASLDPQIGATSSFNCALPSFSLRHDLSSGSYLDSVTPFEPVAGNKGTFALTGRYVGSCKLIRRLGSTYRSKSGLYHRDITLILFSRGNWHLALQVAQAFGGGRYNKKQLIAAAQVMANNYARAVLSIRKEKEEEFTPVITSIFQARVWGDLMQLQERCMMDLINIGTGFCARISRTDMRTSITTVVVTNGILPVGDLHCLDFNAVAGDRRRILMVIEAPGVQTQSPQDLALSLSRRVLHKFGTTLPISDDYDGIWSIQPMERFNIGGSDCEVCSHTVGNARTIDQPQNSTPSALLRIDSKRLKALLKREKLVNKAVSGGICRRNLLCNRMSRRRRGALVRRIR